MAVTHDDGTARFESIKPGIRTDIRGWTLVDMIDQATYHRPPARRAKPWPSTPTKSARSGSPLRLSSPLPPAHLGWLPADFEFHGHEIWHGLKHWAGKSPMELLAAFEDAISLLDECDVDIAHSSIDKAGLAARHAGAADANAYRLALQFLLEKVDSYSSARKILIADEAKEQELRAIKMVADLQHWGAGEVPGRRLTTIIDSLHFVSSRASSGVQMADLVAFLLQRQRTREGHPDAEAAKDRMIATITRHRRTWREHWPAEA